jgi:hypothetical protein
MGTQRRHQSQGDAEEADQDAPHLSPERAHLLHFRRHHQPLSAAPPAKIVGAYVATDKDWHARTTYDI